MTLFGFGKKDKKDKPAEKKAAVSAAVKPASLAAGWVAGVLKKPLITEKAVGSENRNWYVFEVSAGATKPEVKKEVQKLFNVTVEKVNSVNVKARPSLFRGKVSYHGSFKKVMVRLAPGQKMEIVSR